MDLLIDTYGTFIGSTSERLVLRLPGKGKKRITKEYPILISRKQSHKQKLCVKPSTLFTLELVPANSFLV